jgi:hypothetical protein
MHDHLRKLIKGFNGLKNDVDRFKFLAIHPDIFMLRLDNDSTHLNLTESTCKNFTEAEVDDFIDSMGNFDGYLGYSGGVISLLKAIGIDGQPV